MQFKRLCRKALIAIIPWDAPFPGKPEPNPAPKEPRDPLKLARYYQSLLDSGKFESRAALACYLGVSRARVTQVLRRLKSKLVCHFALRSEHVATVAALVYDDRHERGDADTGPDPTRRRARR